MFRKATLEDVKTIREIACAAFPATYSSILTKEQLDYMMEWMYSEATLRRELEGNVTYILLETDAGAIGYASFGPEGDEGNYHLHKIYLLPGWQGRGYGGLLFREAEKEMRGRGARMFELNVNRYNSALDFYLRMGMTVDRSVDFDIGGGFYMNDYILRKYL